MYGYIKGTIKDIDSNYVIIDNNDIGYIIYVPNPYYYNSPYSAETSKKLGIINKLANFH